MSQTTAPADTLPGQTTFNVNATGRLTENNTLVGIEVEMTTLNRDDLRIFVTSTTSNGTFNMNRNPGRTARYLADRICRTDPTHQALITEGRVFGAVVGIGYAYEVINGPQLAKRHACFRDDTGTIQCSGNYQVDWPLAHNAYYKNDNMQVIGRTDSYGRLPLILNYPIGIAGDYHYVWTGMDINYLPLYDFPFPPVPSFSCLTWNTNSNDERGMAGQVNADDFMNIAAGTLHCNEMAALYCAQRANAN